MRATGPFSGVPEPLLEWIARFGAVALDESGRRDAAAAALRALREAIARPGRDREGAFALLAADALLTEAAQDLLAADDPDAELRGLMETISGREWE